MNTNNARTSPKKSVNKPIYSITPFTLLDYPHRSACILWFAGCNMRCSYCYNPDIVFGKGCLSFDDGMAFLKTRQGLLDAVVFSGGECLLHKNIVALATAIKQLGFLIKIDTNGSRPEVLQQLVEEEVIDYVALDFKALPAKFYEITRSGLFLKFEQSLCMLIGKGVDFEVRTTLHSALIDEVQIRLMIGWLERMGYSGNYYLQHYQNDRQTIEALPYSDRTEPSGLGTASVSVVFRG